MGLWVKELKKHNVLLTREQLLKVAERCGNEGSLLVGEAVVKVAMEIEEKDRLDTWDSIPNPSTSRFVREEINI